MTRTIIGPVDSVQAMKIAEGIKQSVYRLPHDMDNYHLDVYLGADNELRIMSDREPVYGWEDPNHEWAFMGNLSVFDVVHGNSIPFSLYRCIECNGLKVGNAIQSEDEYRTPFCRDER